MDYFISFLEGMITFLSPCLLPMIPVYVSYFAGQKRKNPVVNALGFVVGFTVIFVTLGAFAGTIGGYLREYKTAVNLISGIIVVLFGLSFMEIIKIPALSLGRGFGINSKEMGFFSAGLFGVIFAIGWTPCTGAFLGSALMLAAQLGGSMKGIVMLICFSIGLGLPFLITSVLLDRLKNAFDFIKRNYLLINRLSGGFLVIIGILMATGLMGYFLSLLTF